MFEMLESTDTNLSLPKSYLEQWTLSLINNTHTKFYAVIRAGNDGGCTQEGIHFEQISTTPQSHHLIQVGEEHRPLMQYYFIDFIIKCLETSPVTSTQKALMNFMERNREMIADFIAKPGNKTETDWKIFDEIFSLKEMHSYIRYIHERTRELTKKLGTDQHLNTDLFVNMSNMLHCLYRIYMMNTKKNYMEAS